MTTTELEAESYEYYKLEMDKKTLNKTILNSKATASSGLNLDKITIVNAADLNTTNFACATSFSNSSLFELEYSYNVSAQTLVLKNKTSDPIQMFDLKAIHFGDS